MSRVCPFTGIPRGALVAPTMSLPGLLEMLGGGTDELEHGHIRNANLDVALRRPDTAYSHG